MRKPLREAGRTVWWGLVLYGGVQLVGAYLVQNATGAAALQAVLSEFGAGRIAIAWSDPLADPPTAKVIVRRALRGVGLGFGTAIALISLAVLTGGATVGLGAASIAQLLVGAMIAALLAVRDELLLRGVALRAFEGATKVPTALAISGLVAAASHWGTTGSAPLETLSAGVLGVAFAALWIRDRGAWMAWGAHTAWTWTMGAATHGGIIDVRASAGRWGGGDAGLEAGIAAGCVLVATAVVASIWAARGARFATFADSR